MTTAAYSLQPDSRRMKSAYVYHIPVAGKPLEPGERMRLGSLVKELIAQLASGRELQPRYFVQTSRLQKPPWRDLLHENAKFWSVKTGLVVRPNRPLPGPLTIKDILSLKPPILPELVHEIGEDKNIRFFAPDQTIPSVIDVYLGCGGCAIFLVADPAEFLPQAKRLFASTLDPAFAGFDFCLPVFKLKDFTSASADTLETWFRLFDVYIAEVQEDPGLLIASREPLDQAFAGLGHLLHGTSYEHR